MYSNFIKVFFILILFYQGPVQSKVKDINKFDHKDLSNYFSGLISFNQNKNTEALNFFNSSKILKDQHTPYLQSYIKILVQEKKTNIAIKELKKNLNNENIDFFEGYLLLLIDSVQQKNFKKSKQYLSKISELSQNNTFNLIIYESLKNYIYLFENKKKFVNKSKFGNLNLIAETFENCYLDLNETKNSYTKLVSTNEPDYSRYKFFYINYLLKKNQIEQVRKLAKKINTNRSNLLISQTVEWVESENFKKINDIFSCSEENHILSEFLYLIANLYSSEGIYDVSNFYVNISNFLNPKFIYNLSLLAENHIFNKNYTLAKNILNKFDKKDQSYFWYKVKKNTLIISEKSGDEKAIKFLNLQFKKIKKPNVKILYDYANLMKNFQEHDIAINYYTKLLSILKNDSIFYSEILYRRGGSYERLELFEKSDEDLLQSLKLNPEDAYVLNYLAYSWLERNFKIEIAIDMLERAYKKESDSPYILDSIGWAYYLIGDYIKAEKFLKQAIEIMPYDPIINDHYGDILWSLNRKMQAQYHWKSVLKLEDTENDMKEKIKLKILFGPKNT